MEENVAKLIAGLFTEIAAIREVLVQSVATRAASPEIRTTFADNFLKEFELKPIPTYRRRFSKRSTISLCRLRGFRRFDPDRVSPDLERHLDRRGSLVVKPDAWSFGASACNSRSDRPFEAQRPMRAKSNLLARFDLICPVHPFTPQIISDFPKLSLTLDPNQQRIPRHPVPREGTLAIVTDVGAGSGGREGCD